MAGFEIQGLCVRVYLRDLSLGHRVYGVGLRV
jgi:hypothetical protein